MSQTTISLYAGHATPANIVLRSLPVLAATTTPIWLYVGHATPANIILGDPTVPRPGAPGFPTQFAGLRTWYGGAMRELCLVAIADGHAGQQLRVRKNATTYVVYLVDTADANASHVRIGTSAGTKAIRLKT